MAMRAVYWIDLNRFDTKPDKSTWLEMGHVLNSLNYQVMIITSYANMPFDSGNHNVQFTSLKSSRLSGLFKIVLLLRTISFLIREGDRDAIIVLPVAGLLIAPIIRPFGFKKIHLDVRTVPVSLRGFRRLLDKIIFWDIPLRLCCSYVTSSSFITRGLKDTVMLRSGCTFEDACIWSSGVNPELFSKSKRKFSDARPYRFFYHGTVTEDRGILEMISAIDSLDVEIARNIQLTVVGPGPDLGRFGTLIEKRNWSEQVSLVGYVPYADMPSLLHTADCCICPLPARPEWQVSSPLKVLEYMASSKPIIATKISAHTEILEHADFVVWTKGFGARSFALAMETAYLDRWRLARAAAHGQAIVESKYDWTRLGTTFSKYFSKKYG